MDKINSNSYIFAPNTGCKFLSAFFGFCALGLFIVLFQPFIDVFERIFVILTILPFLWLFWITKKLSYTKAKVDNYGITLWNSKTNEKIYANWTDFVIAYRLQGFKGASTFVFAKEPMHTKDINKALKASFSYKTGISFVNPKAIFISGGFHEKRMKSFFINKVPIQDL